MKQAVFIHFLILATNQPKMVFRYCDQLQIASLQHASDMRLHIRLGENEDPATIQDIELISEMIEL